LGSETLLITLPRQTSSLPGWMLFPDPVVACLLSLWQFACGSIVDAILGLCHLPLELKSASLWRQCRAYDVLAFVGHDVLANGPQGVELPPGRLVRGRIDADDRPVSSNGQIWFNRNDVVQQEFAVEGPAACGLTNGCLAGKGIVAFERAAGGPPCDVL